MICVKTHSEVRNMNRLGKRLVILIVAVLCVFYRFTHPGGWNQERTRRVGSQFTGEDYEANCGSDREKGS